MGDLGPVICISLVHSAHRRPRLAQSRDKSLYACGCHSRDAASRTDEPLGVSGDTARSRHAWEHEPPQGLSYDEDATAADQAGEPHQLLQ